MVNVIVSHGTSDLGETLTLTFTHYLHSANLLEDIVTRAKQEIAKEIWEKYADKIMAQLDAKGMAALIAAYAAKNITPEIKK